MIGYQFEYSKLNVIWRIMILAFTAFLILIALTVLFHNSINIWAGIAMTILIPYLIFVFNKKRIKAVGRASLATDSVNFNLGKDNITYDFDDIVSYKIEYYHGVALNLRLKNRNKFRLLSNDNFCNSERFGTFCTAFETTIDKYKSDTESISIREKSILEKRWFLALLIILTFIVVSALAYALLTDKAQPSSILISSVSLISLWLGYFTTKRVRRERD